MRLLDILFAQPERLLEGVSMKLSNTSQALTDPALEFGFEAEFVSRFGVTPGVSDTNDVVVPRSYNELERMNGFDESVFDEHWAEFVESAVQNVTDEDVDSATVNLAETIRYHYSDSDDYQKWKTKLIELIDEHYEWQLEGTEDEHELPAMRQRLERMSIDHLETEAMAQRLDYERLFREVFAEQIEAAAIEEVRFKLEGDDVHQSNYFIDFIESSVGEQYLAVLRAPTPGNGGVVDEGKGNVHLAEEIENMLGIQIGSVSHDRPEGERLRWVLGADGGNAELVSKVYPFRQGLEVLKSVVDYIDEFHSTDSYSSLHVTIGYQGARQQDFDPLKLVIFLGEKYLLGLFKRGRARNRVDYARPQAENLQLLARKILIDNNDPNTGNVRHFITTVSEMFDQEISSLYRAFMTADGHEAKYRSVNVIKAESLGAFEFRIIGNSEEGGRDWQKKWSLIYPIIMRYGYLIALASNPMMERREYMKKLTLLANRILAPEKKDNQRLSDQAWSASAVSLVPRQFRALVVLTDEERGLMIHVPRASRAIEWLSRGKFVPDALLKELARVFLHFEVAQDKDGHVISATEPMHRRLSNFHTYFADQVHVINRKRIYKLAVRQQDIPGSLRDQALAKLAERLEIGRS